MLLYNTLAVLLATVAGTSTESPDSLRCSVDLIELNHFVDEEGREVFRQVIFYDWSRPHRRFHVRAWRLVKTDSQLPQRGWNPRGYRCTWHDDGVMCQVWAPKMRETWSQKDPERVNRKYLPEDQRTPLFVSTPRRY